MTPEIRPLTGDDWPAVGAIVREVAQARETFPYDPRMTPAEARAMWVEQPPGRTVVAVVAGEIAGTAKMGPNRAGPGAHIATASYMVAAAARGRGVGTALCRHSIDWARQQGYAGVQFNAVVETNTVAVDLYRRFGFQIIGTVPRSFDHPVHGRVGMHVMFLEF
ncbi:GNAT family N-acetyltransferase [Actinoplanes sp. NPDC024001]|uniref:GNAT family N-acetyltransferase n=1 Tax=Actinoplanes sp. NPDC024001 TaxID=3154598 RepID=UPI003400B07E